MAADQSITVLGYAYPFISTEVLEDWLPDLTAVLSFSYGVREDGSLIPLADEALLAAVCPNPLPAEEGVEGTGSVCRDVQMVLTPMNEEGQFSSELAGTVLRNEEIRRTLAENIRNTVIEKNYAGVNFDFEYVQREDRDLYVELVRETAALLRPLGLLTTVALVPKTSADQPGLLYGGHDYRGMGEAADLAMLMTYEWGYTYGPPMAVAPLDKVEQVLLYGLSEIPAEKILLGIPNYGYDWTLPFEAGISEAGKLSIDEAFALAASYGAEIQFDETAQSPYFFYTGEDGREHEVWFEDERSLTAKLKLIDKYGLAGAFYWNIMSYYAGNSEALAGLYQVLPALPEPSAG